MKPRFHIGIDGGGTGCRARIAAPDGAALGEGYSGPASLRLGGEAAWSSVRAAVLSALQDAGLTEDDLPSCAAAAGLAGVGRVAARDEFAALASAQLPMQLTSDAEAACIGAHGGDDGGIVIAGTGSIALALVGGRQIRFGGFGFPIGDEGSGAEIGLQAIRMALRAADGRAPQSSFYQDVLAKLGGDARSAVTWMDNATATDYATFAPAVFRHADDGDPSARAIVQKAAEDIDSFVRTLRDADVPRVALLGGLSSPIQPWLAPDVRRFLSDPLGDAIEGALIVARRNSAS